MSEGITGRRDVLLRVLRFRSALVLFAVAFLLLVLSVHWPYPQESELSFSSGIAVAGPRTKDADSGYGAYVSIFKKWPREELEEVCDVVEGFIADTGALASSFTFEALPRELLHRYGPLLLAEGSMPVSGEDAVVLGPNWQKGVDETIVVGDVQYRVSGKLNDSAALWRDAALTTTDCLRRHYEIGDTPNIVYLLPRAGFSPLRIRMVLAEHIRQDLKADQSPAIRDVPAPFVSSRLTFYLVGLFLVFVATIVACAAVVVRFDETVPGLPRPLKIFAAPLAALRANLGAYVAVNCWLLGLMFAAIVLGTTETGAVFQAGITDVVQQSFGEGGPLAYIGRAYETSVVLATMATFFHNLVLGAILTTTIPSFLIPGFGLMLNSLRFFVLGVALAPGSLGGASIFIPHVPVAVIELQAYVVATFAVLRICEALIDPRRFRTTSRVQSYSAALAETAVLYRLVVLLLAVGAIYEAFEIRHLTGLFIR